MKKECVSNVVHNFLAAVPRVPRLHREIVGGARGPAQIAEVEISSVPATKIAALRDSEGSGSQRGEGGSKSEA